jgi:small subunit ribosomal protein S35
MAAVNALIPFGLSASMRSSSAENISDMQIPGGNRQPHGPSSPAMAFVARYLGRTAFSVARRGPTAIKSRPFSVTPFKFLPEDPPITREPPPEDELPDVPEYSPDLLSKEERSMYDMLSPEEREAFDAEQRRIIEEFKDPQVRAAAFAEIEKSVRDLEKEVGLRFEDVPDKSRGFWAEEEDDEFGLVEDADDDFHDDEITSMAHAEVELHREIREYARIAAWDMPLLSSKFHFLTDYAQC